MKQKVNQDEAYEVGDSRMPYSGTELWESNENFIAAMAAAIRAGLERPPRVGVDRRPGTKNPTSYFPERFGS
jgi:hypothetical protein